MPQPDTEYGSGYRRTHSEALEKARREGRQETLLKQLVEDVHKLSTTVQSVQSDVVDIKLSLKDGSAKMDRIDGELKQHLDDASNDRKQWKGVVPIIVASVAASLVTSGIIALMVRAWLPPGAD